MKVIRYEEISQEDADAIINDSDAMIDDITDAVVNDESLDQPDTSNP